MSILETKTVNTRSSGPPSGLSSSVNVRKRRPLSAYMLWMNAEGRKLGKKSLDPDAGVVAIAKKCAKVWHSLTPEERGKWQAIARDLEEREQKR